MKVGKRLIAKLLYMTLIATGLYPVGLSLGTGLGAASMEHASRVMMGV